MSFQQPVMMKGCSSNRPRLLPALNPSFHGANPCSQRQNCGSSASLTPFASL